MIFRRKFGWIHQGNELWGSSGKPNLNFDPDSAKTASPLTHRWHLSHKKRRLDHGRWIAGPLSDVSLSGGVIFLLHNLLLHFPAEPQPVGGGWTVSTKMHQNEGKPNQPILFPLVSKTVSLLPSCWVTVMLCLLCHIWGLWWAFRGRGWGGPIAICLILFSTGNESIYQGIPLYPWNWYSPLEFWPFSPFLARRDSNYQLGSGVGWGGGGGEFLPLTTGTSVTPLHPQLCSNGTRIRKI